jgi:two-component system CheB/CheR fusion protein
VLFACEVYDAHQPLPDIETDNELQTLRVSELEQELMAMREHLQTTIEELETSNEELQSTNEELQSANEELQSTNEELETANEELQSTNEELSTVNQELQIKTAELASVNADLENILASMSIPMLVVDNRLRITRFSSAAKHVFDLKQSDLGQIITSLNTNFVMTDLRNQIHQVMQDGIMLKATVQSSVHAYQLTITPYYSEKRQVQGALILFESTSDTDR